MRMRLPVNPSRPLHEFGLFLLALVGSVCLLTAACYAQGGTSAPDVVQLVRNAAYNEQRSGADHPFRYLYRKEEDGKTTLKEVLETHDGTVARLLERDGKPLSADDNQAELARLTKLRGDPDAQAKRTKREHADGERANTMTQLLPQAFLYTYAGMVPGPNGPCHRLLFAPNPNWTPPSREAEVYHGMTGELWIDAGQQRLARFQAHLVTDVNFGWGVVGRLFKGGTILVEQEDVGDHHWEPTHMRLNLTGKILLVKSLDINTTENLSDFHPIEPMSVSAAITELAAMPLEGFSRKTPGRAAVQAN